jgi:hypothetical protein
MDACDHGVILVHECHELSRDKENDKEIPEYLHGANQKKSSDRLLDLSEPFRQQKEILDKIDLRQNLKLRPCNMPRFRSYRAEQDDEK